MTDRTPIKTIVDKVIGSVEQSEYNPGYYAIKDKSGEVIAYVEASFCFDKNWNWFDDSNIEMEGAKDEPIAD